MHPLLHQQLAKQHMEELQRETVVWKRIEAASADLDHKTGDRSFIRALWYLLFGLRISTYGVAGAGQELPLDGFQKHLNAAICGVGFVALGLGLLVGSFLNSSFGPVPAILLSGVILFMISLPVAVRSIVMLRER